MELFAIIGVFSSIYWVVRLALYLYITNSPLPPEYNRGYIYPARYTPLKPRGQVTTVTPQREDVTPKKASPGRIVDHTNLEE